MGSKQRDTPAVMRHAARLLCQRFIFSAGLMDDDFLIGLVDQVVLPLFGVGPKGNRPNTWP